MKYNEIENFLKCLVLINFFVFLVENVFIYIFQVQDGDLFAQVFRIYI